MARINGTAEDDTLRGAGDDDRIRGKGGDDVLDGSYGDDTVEGGSGEDVLTGDGGVYGGDEGRDVFIGGRGRDTFNLFNDAWINSTFGRIDVIADFEGGGAAGGDQLVLGFIFLPPDFGFGAPLLWRGDAGAPPVEGGTVAGAANGFVDVYIAYGAGGAFLFADSDDDGVLTGGSYNDFIIRLDGVTALNEDDFIDTQFAILGSESGEILNGTRRGDYIAGYGGADRIDGRGGVDEVDGGEGADTLVGGLGDLLRGEAGDDVLRLRLDGVAYGGEGDDKLRGGSAYSMLDGGAGRDEIRLGDTGGSAYGADGRDRLFGGAGQDDMFGDLGADVLSGAGDFDNMFGGGGADVMNGGSGNDWIDGGAGADELTGGPGADSFRYFGQNLGFDVIIDFEDGADSLFFAGPGDAYDTDLEIIAAAEQDGDDLVIDIGGTVIRILDFELARLDGSDIRFIGESFAM